MSPSVLVLAVVLGTALFLAQPLVLKASCALCGEQTPRYFTGLVALFVTSVISAIAGGVYAISLGAFLAGASPLLAGLGALLISGIVTSIVYSAFLRVGVVDAAKVALVHHLLGLGLSAAVGLAFDTFIAG